MGWRQIYVADVAQDLTPAESAVIQSVQNSNARLASKLSDTASEFIGAIAAAQGPESVVTDGRVPDQLRSHIASLAIWRLLRSVPTWKAIKTPEREAAAKDAERIYEKICNRTYGAIESPYCARGAAGMWNSENKLILRTHPVPPPTAQFPPTFGSTSFDRDGDSGGLVFTGPAGTVPPFRAAPLGQQAFNQDTNEGWFVNTSGQWQQQVAI